MGALRRAARGFAGWWNLAGATLLHPPMPERRGISVGVSALCFEQGVNQGPSLLARRSQLMTAAWPES